MTVSYRGTRYIYTGPFFIGDDHGCGHTGPSPHGVGLGEEQACIEWPRQDEANRRALRAACFKAIDSSDYVFAWLEELAYGTVAELAYAYAKGKAIHTAGPAASLSGDLWFVSSLGRVYPTFKGTPEDAFDLVLRRIAPPDPVECESPAESNLYKELAKRFSFTHDERGRMVGVNGKLRLHCQYEVAPYRLDFALLGPDVQLAIEVDGHDFHDRTKEQASRDRERDRFLQRAGWKVFRFTGSDVYHRAQLCADEVFTAAGMTSLLIVNP